MMVPAINKSIGEVTNGAREDVRKLDGMDYASILKWRKLKAVFIFFHVQGRDLLSSATVLLIP